MKRIITICLSLVLGLSVTGQIGKSIHGSLLPKQDADTLYFPYENDVQLIIIDQFDTWSNHVSFLDMMNPRGGSYALDLGPPPKNTYIFRNKEGIVTHLYNVCIDSNNVENSYMSLVPSEEYKPCDDLLNDLINSLKEPDYVNADSSMLRSIMDYRELNKHLMIYGDSNTVGLIDLTGNIVIPTEYHHIATYQNTFGRTNKLIIRKGEFCGLLDSNLTMILAPKYKFITSFYPHKLGIIKVSQGEKQGLINETGEVLIDFEYDDIRMIHDSLYTGLIHKSDSELTHSIKGYWNGGYRVKNCIVFDKDFNAITRLEGYEYIQYWGIKNFIVKKDGKFGVVDHLGQIIIPLEYKTLSPYRGFYFVTSNGKCGLFSYEGELVLPIEFESIEATSGGPAIYVKKNGLIGIYNRNLELIAEPQFRYKTWDDGKYVLWSDDGRSGFVKYQKDDPYYQSPEGEIIKL